MTERRANRLAWIVIGTVLLASFLPALIGTHWRMAEIRTRISPGMSLAELHNFAGPPKQVIHRGEALIGPRRSYTVPVLDEHTAVYVYRHEGLPYFNVYVLLDERQNVVIRSEVESLWWGTY